MKSFSKYSKWKAIIEKLHAEKGEIAFEKYEALSSADKIKHLISLQADIESLNFEDELVRDTILSVKTIAAIQQDNGVAGSHRYVISNCQHALHIIEVFTLGRLLMGKDDALELDVVQDFRHLRPGTSI